MKLHILFGQRECQYSGEYAPEAIHLADENTMSDNPDWIEEKLKEAESWNEYKSLQIVVVDLGPNAQSVISDRLNNNFPPLVGIVN